MFFKTNYIIVWLGAASKYNKYNIMAKKSKILNGIVGLGGAVAGTAGIVAIKNQIKSNNNDND